MPNIRQYFEQFSPTLRYLTLEQPTGTYRHILFFMGLFPHLEDLVLRGVWDCAKGNPTDDSVPAPPSIPPLRGSLTARDLTHDLVKTMVGLFRGVRFRHMNLSRVAGAHHLLYSCGNVLETLNLDASDVCSKKISWGDVQVPTKGFTDTYSRDLDLSRNKSLWGLGITAQSLIDVLRTHAPATEDTKEISTVGPI